MARVWNSHRDQPGFARVGVGSLPTACPGRSSPKKPKSYRVLGLDQLSQSVYSPKSSLVSPLLVCRSLGRWKLS